jgi:hypothetical protein
MELVQLEAGFNDCPLNHPFSPIMGIMSLIAGFAPFGGLWTDSNSNYTSGLSHNPSSMRKRSSSYQLLQNVWC